MDTIQYLIDLFLHLDKHLSALIAQFGGWTYVPLFIVIFIETGLVVTPFLPGDSLLFAAGSLAALPDSPLHIVVLYVIVAIAAVLGDTANYWIGHYMGPKVFTGNNRFIKKEYLDRTHDFYEKHGAITIILARFIPIIRTFAPFVAGIGRMTYWHFISYNIIGGIVWTALFTFGGYFFGNLPFVQNHFSIVVLAIIIISVIPAVVEVFRSRQKPKAEIEA
ncbi:MAG: DedA family protein [Anaerolineaceae bacterium]